MISVWTRKHTKLHAMKLLGEAGLPAGAVLDTDELNKDVTFEQRGACRPWSIPYTGHSRCRAGRGASMARPRASASSPMLGEHTNQVLSDWLGLTAQAVAEMKREGVI